MPAILSGGMVPAAVRGATVSALFHICDWLPTLLHAVTGTHVQLMDAASPEIPYDGMDQWAVVIHAAAHGARSEVVLDHCLEGFSKEPTGAALCVSFLTI